MDMNYTHTTQHTTMSEELERRKAMMERQRLKRLDPAWQKRQQELLEEQKKVKEENDAREAPIIALLADTLQPYMAIAKVGHSGRVPFDTPCDLSKVKDKLSNKHGQILLGNVSGGVTWLILPM